MTTAQLTEIDSAEASQVLRWRVRTLLGAGYAYRDAVVLALDAGVDLHAARTLVRRGCPSPLAVRILL